MDDKTKCEVLFNALKPRIEELRKQREKEHLHKIWLRTSNTIDLLPRKPSYEKT